MSEENIQNNEPEIIAEEVANVEVEGVSEETAAVVEEIQAKVEADGIARAPKAANANKRPDQQRGPGGGNRGPGGGARGAGGGRGGQQGGGHGGKGRRRNEERSRTEEPSEYTEKVVQVRRVTKVVKGGKKMSFRAAVVIGNEKGKVGVGVGKAAEVVTAIKKAISDARKNVVEVTTVKTTISHTVFGVAGGSKILLKPAAEGTGIIAGGTARIVLELAGVGDILAKSQGSKSPLNVARATVRGLKSLRTFQEVARERGLSVREMLN